MGKPVPWALAFHAVSTLLVSSCTCRSPDEPVNGSGISEGHMPPELPPMPAPKGTSTEKAPPGDAAEHPAPAPSASPGRAAGGGPELSWTTPPGWRFLGQPGFGPVRGHFYAAEEGAEHVDVYVVHRVAQVAARGLTADDRFRDSIARESEGFARVDSKDVTTRTSGKRTVTVVELRGVRREAAANEGVVELPNRVQVSALIPTDGFPIRVAMDGRADLVERSRDAFFAFVDSLQLQDRDDGAR